MPICDAQCFINGNCIVPGKCECQKGWRGNNCQECAANCANNGYCSNDNPTKCICPPGWAGLTCQIRMKPLCFKNTCKNGGTCNSTRVAVNSNNPEIFQCVCPKDFGGNDCSIKVNLKFNKTCFQMDGCSNLPCGRHGVCTIINDFNFICKCNNGFSGKYCTEIDNLPTTISTTASTPISHHIDQQLAIHNIFMALLVGISFMAFLSFCLFKVKKFGKKNRRQNLTNSDILPPPPSYNMISPKIINSMENAIKIDISPSKIFPTNCETLKNKAYCIDISKINALTKNLQCHNNRWRHSLKSKIFFTFK